MIQICMANKSKIFVFPQIYTDKKHRLTRILDEQWISTSLNPHFHIYTELVEVLAYFHIN